MKILTQFLAGIAAFILSIASASAASAPVGTPFNLVGTAGAGLLAGNEPGAIVGGTGGEIGTGIVYDTGTRQLTVNVGWGSGNGFTDLSSLANNSHIHGPTASANGNGFTQTAGVVFTLTRTSSSASTGTIVNNVWTLNATQEAQLFDGKFYINVHTANNGGGEIRGFLVPVAPPNSPPTVTLIGAPVVSIEASAAPYVDPGATPADVDGNLTGMTVTLNNVNAALPGNYSVTYTATDSLGATGTATRTVNVVDTTPPAVVAPANITVEATNPIGGVVTFGGSASDVVGVTSLTSSPSSGSLFPLGTTTVVFLASDAAMNSATASFTVTVRDTTPPIFTTTIGVTNLPANTPLPDYTTQVAAFDFVSIPTITQSPAPGTIFTGPAPLTVTLTARDAANNTVSSFFDVFAEILVSTDPVLSVLASKGAAVPGAGVLGSGIPAGAVWDSFGVPSVNDAGQVAFNATMKVGTKIKTGTFTGGPATVTLQRVTGGGDPAPGIPSAVMSAMKDPLLGPDGSVAWVATLANAPGATGAVTPANNVAIYLDADGAGPNAATLVARKGDATSGGAVYAAFTSVAMGRNAVAFTATFVSNIGGVSPGPGGVTLLSDTALCVYDRDNSTTGVALREGEVLLGSTIKTIAALVSRPGTAGQGHGVVDFSGGGSYTTARVTLTDKRQTIVGINQSALVFPFYTTGASAPDYGAGALWATFGLPTQNSGSAFAFLGTVKPLTGTATTANNVAIFAENDTYTLARVVGKGDSAAVSGGTFSALKDPVNAGNGSVAFLGTMKANSTAGIGATNNDGVWSFTEVSGLTIEAWEGAQPPEAPLGAQWKSFNSLALAGGNGGVMFVGTMHSKTGLVSPGPGGITTANDVGLWAADGTGALRLLLQEGDTIGGATVKTFTVLSSVLGSPAQTRSFNNDGSVIVRVTDTTNAKHIVHIAIPQGMPVAMDN